MIIKTQNGARRLTNTVIHVERPFGRTGFAFSDWRSELLPTWAIQIGKGELMDSPSLRLASNEAAGFGRRVLNRLSLLVVCWCLGAGSICIEIQARQQALRPMEVDDMFKLQRVEIGDEPFSPRG